MRFIKIIGFLLFLSFTTYSQVKIDYDFIIKSAIFNNRAYVRYKDTSNTINDFNTFYREFKLHFDTLKSYGFKAQYIFLSINDSLNYVSNNKYYKGGKYDGGFFDPFKSDLIFCLNRLNGKLYRLKGFFINDFYNFQRDMRVNEKITLRKFLKNFEVVSLNFYCLSKTISKMSIDETDCIPINAFKNSVQVQ